MRVTQNGMIRQVVTQVQDRFERLADLERQMTTGLMIENPSEDPHRASDILTARDHLQRGERYLKNSQLAARELQAAESAVGQVNDIVSRAKATAVQGANGSLSESDRASLAQEVQGQIDELLRIANQRYGSGYLLGGSDSSTAPIETVRDDDGMIVGVIIPQSATNDPLSLIVGQDQLLETSVSPGDLFDLGDGENLFSKMIELRDALRSGDRELLNDSVASMQDAIDLTSSTTTLVGGRLQTAEAIIGRLEEANLKAESNLAEVADADAIETISKYNQEQSVYEMALKTAARVIQPSLVNFL